MQAVGIGDLHLSPTSGVGALSKYVPESDRFVCGEVDKVVKWAERKNITNVFLYGDTCCGPRMSYEAIGALSAVITAHPESQFYVILGNHDMFSEDPSDGHALELLKLFRLPNLKIITKPTRKKIDDAKVFFLPYPHVDFRADSLNIFHNEVKGSTNDAGRSFDHEGLTKSKAVACGGHLHTAQQVRNTYYSGTLYQTTFGEQLEKYFHHIDFESPEEYEITLVPHKAKYTLHNVVIQERADLKLIPTGKTELVKLVIQDGADVTASDYSQFSNIVVTKPFKSQDELATVLTEDLVEGQQLVIRTDEFFAAWLEARDVSDKLKARTVKYRRRILEQVRA